MSASAHYKLGGRRVCLIDAVRNPNGSVTGTAPGYDNGFGQSAGDRRVTLDKATVKRLRVRLIER